MYEGWVHVVKEVNPKGDLIQNPQTQRPGKNRVHVLLLGRDYKDGLKIS